MCLVSSKPSNTTCSSAAPPQQHLVTQTTACSPKLCFLGQYRFQLLRSPAHSWRTTLCLQYDHQTLAAAAMWLAFKLHRVEPVLEEGEPWFTRLLQTDLKKVQGE